MNKEYVLRRFQSAAQKPLSFEEIEGIFKLSSQSDYDELNTYLEALLEEGALIKTRTDRYALPEQLNLLVGRIKMNKKGFGFLISENPDQDDLFIPAGDLNGALNQDQVIVRITRPASVNTKTGASYRAEGEVIRILKRAKTVFLGTLDKRKHYGFVVPDSQLVGNDIFVPEEAFLGAKSGDKVLVEITKWAEKNRNAEGKIISVVGHEGDPGMDVLSIIYQHNLRQTFPKAVLDAARQIPQHIDEATIQSRRDQRFLPYITIDGEDSKDLDDAVFLERMDNGHFLLGVSIADVGEYVIEDSILDVEAYKRGTSVYLVDRVLPMLPTELSNGICSLNPNEDRLTLSCVMEIDSNGRLISSDVFESVINTSHRMTYNEVNAILDGDEALRKRYGDVVPMLEEMAELQKILFEKRHKRGAIEFDIRESGVRLDENGKAIEVFWRSRGLSERIIEEFMIVANETVAEHYFWLHIPFIYRVHEAPEHERLEAVRDYLQIAGYTLHIGGEQVKPADYQKVLEAVDGTPQQYPINMVMLRSMRHAYYSSNPLGHFGLGARYYTHFTSPIRRYSDLAIHRVIKEMLQYRNRMSEKRRVVLAEVMARYAVQASNTERMAEEAERNSVDLKKVEYMADHVGEVFEGTIVSVVAFGLFVQLDNSVEGLVHISTMVDDFYQFIPQTLELVGEHAHKRFTLGQRVKVQLTKANVEQIQLDFILLDEQVVEDESDRRK